MECLGEGGLGEAPLGVFSGDPGLKRRALPAAFNGRCLPRVRLLLQRGCLSVEERDCLGRTLLYRAVQDNDLNYARLFLQYHADVRAADSQLSPGLQPLLHLAVTGTSPDMVGLLVEAGADPYAIHGAWGSALRLAVRLRKPKIVRVLLEGGTGPRDRHRKPKVVRGLLKGGTGPRDRQSQRDYQSLLRLAVRESRRRTFDLLWRHRGSSFPCVDLFAYALFACNKLAFARTILKRSRGPKLIAMKELSGLRYVCQADEATFNPKPVFQRWTKAMALRWAEPKTPVLKEEPPESLAGLLGTREVQTRRELAELPRTWDQTLVQAVLVAERLVPRRRELTWLLVRLAEALFKRHEDRLAAAALVRAVRAALTCHVTKVDGTTRESLLQTVADCEESHVDRLTRDDVLRLLELAACAVRGGAPYFTRDFPAAGSRRSRVTSFADGCVWRNLRRWFTLQGPATPEQVGLLEASLTRYVKDRHALRLLFPLQRMRDVNCVRALEVLVATSAAVWGECGQEGHPFHLAPDVDGDTPLHILAQHVPAALLTGDRGVVAIFLQHGAHLCARNGQGCRIADTLEARQILVPESRVPCLTCLAARAVPRRPSLEESVPRVVWKFLQDH